jgi:hypothetical protein
VIDIYLAALALGASVGPNALTGEIALNLAFFCDIAEFCAMLPAAKGKKFAH